MNSTKFTIVTVVKNGMPKLINCIQSVLGQSYENFEYVIVDGMSTDGTSEYIASLKSKKLNIIRDIDDGIYHAMNKAAVISTGDFISFLNSDDCFANDNILGLVDSILSSELNLDIVSGSICSYVVQKNKNIFSLPIINKNSKYVYLPHPSTFVRRELLLKSGMFSLKYKISSDMDLFYRLILQKEDVNFLLTNSVFAFYSLGGVSSMYSYKQIKENYIILKEYRGFWYALTGLIFSIYYKFRGRVGKIIRIIPYFYSK